MDRVSRVAPSFHAQRQYSTFLRTVAEHRSAPRGRDGGYIVPRYLYSHLLDGKSTAPYAPLTPHARVVALAPLANSALLADDEGVARALVISLVAALCVKVPRWLLRTMPPASFEMEASGEATYKAPNGKLVNAFEADQTVFRIAVRLPDVLPKETETDTGTGM